MSNPHTSQRDDPDHDDWPMPDDALRLTHDLTVRDGSVVRVRAIRADDTARLQSFHAHLSMESIIWRFFRSAPSLSECWMSCIIVASPVARATRVATSSPRWISPLRHASGPGRLLTARQRGGKYPAHLV